MHRRDRGSNHAGRETRPIFIQTRACTARARGGAWTVPPGTVHHLFAEFFFFFLFRFQLFFLFNGAFFRPFLIRFFSRFHQINYGNAKNTRNTLNRSQILLFLSRNSPLNRSSKIRKNRKKSEILGIDFLIFKSPHYFVWLPFDPKSCLDSSLGQSTRIYGPPITSNRH